MNTKCLLGKSAFVVCFLLLMLVFTFAVKLLLHDKVLQLQNNQENDAHISKYNILKETYFSHLKYEGLFADKNLCLLDTNCEEINLSRIVGDKPKLFIKLYSPNCQVCIDLLILEIEKIKTKVNKSDIVFYCENRNDVRYTMVDRVYVSGGHSINGLFETVKAPLLFVLDTSLQVSCIYIADKTISEEMTIPYFQTVGKRFFDWDVKLFETDGKHHCSDTNCQHNHQ